MAKGGLELLASATKYPDFSHQAYHLCFPCWLKGRKKESNYLWEIIKEHKNDKKREIYYDFSTTVGLYCLAIWEESNFFWPKGVGGSS